MVSQINVTELKRLLEEQKKAALYGTVHVWSDPATAATVNTTCNKCSSITKNPTLFVTHAYSANGNPAAIVKEMAGCFPRLLIVCFFNNNEKLVYDWALETFPKFISDMPFADLRVINTSNLLKTDADFLLDLHVEANPTVLVAKLGHIIDAFHPNICGDPILSEALLQRHLEIMAQNGRPVIPGDDVAHLMPNYDFGKDAYEQRERERRRIELEKERKAKAEEEKRVKARIAEMRKNRREND